MASHVFNTEEEDKKEYNKSLNKYAKKRQLTEEYLNRNKKEKISSLKMVPRISNKSSMKEILTGGVNSLNNSFNEDKEPKETKKTQGIKIVNNEPSNQTKERIFTQGDLEYFLKEKKNLIAKSLKYRRFKKDNVKNVIEYQKTSPFTKLDEKPNNVKYSIAIKNLRKNVATMKNDIY